MLRGAIAALGMPKIVRAEAETTLRFAPHADLAISDQIFSIDDITRNYSMAVFDTLYGFDANYTPHPQTIRGWGKRDAMGSALLARTDDLSAPSDKVFRLKQPFGLLPTALAQFYCPTMPEWQSKTDKRLEPSGEPKLRSRRGRRRPPANRDDRYRAPARVPPRERRKSHNFSTCTSCEIPWIRATSRDADRAPKKRCG